MNQRNLYRIIIGTIMIVSGIIGAVFAQGLARPVDDEDVHEVKH